MFTKKNMIVIGIILTIVVCGLFAGSIQFDENNQRGTGLVYGEVWIYNLETGIWTSAPNGLLVHVTIDGAPMGQAYDYPTTFNGEYLADFVGIPNAINGDRFKVQFVGYNSGWLDWNYEDGATLDIWYNPSE